MRAGCGVNTVTLSQHTINNDCTHAYNSICYHTHTYYKTHSQPDPLTHTHTKSRTHTHALFSSSPFSHFKSIELIASKCYHPSGVITVTIVFQVSTARTSMGMVTAVAIDLFAIFLSYTLHLSLPLLSLYLRRIHFVSFSPNSHTLTILHRTLSTSPY